MAARASRSMLVRNANAVGAGMLLLVGLSFVFRVAGGFLPDNDAWAQSLFSVIACAVSLGVPLLFFLLQGQDLGVRFSVGRSAIPHWVLLALFLGAMVLLNSLSSVLQGLVLSRLSVPAPPEAPLPENGGALWLYFFNVCILAPLLEELLFRGAMQGLLRRWGKRFAMMVSSLLFLAMHARLWDLPVVFALGLLLSYVAEISGSVWPCVLLHFANNLSSFLLAFIRQRMSSATAIAFYFWAMFLFVALFCGALWSIRQNRLLPAFKLEKNWPTKPGKTSRGTRLLQAKWFVTAGWVSVGYFVYRIFL